jgi:hypothetical protein
MPMMARTVKSFYVGLKLAYIIVQQTIERGYMMGGDLFVESRDNGFYIVRGWCTDETGDDNETVAGPYATREAAQWDIMHNMAIG